MALFVCRNKFIALLIVFTLSNQVYGSAKLNVPRLLLPYYSTVATNFTLEITKGCFTWRTTRPEIAAIYPVGESDPSACSSQAVVTSTSRVPSKKTAIIFAEDPVSGQSLRCDVIVDEIYSIAVETTTHELYLDDSPEEFVIRAMNDEGDVFSSLEGMTFEWNLLSDTESGQKTITPAHNVLRILKFAESSYKTQPYIKMLESQGKRGERILVRGIRTGSAKVGVRPEDNTYKKLTAAEVRIIVVANIQINPPVVYLLQHSLVVYTVELLKQGKSQVIPMPSQQYYLEVANDAVAKLDTKSSTVIAIDMGDTEIKLKDRNIKVAGTFREPTGGIYVVNPGYLEFVVLPSKNWVLETGRTYEIVLDIYDKESHKIFPSDNVKVTAVFPSKYFQVLFSSNNGTYHVVKTLKKGLTVLDGELKGIYRTDGTEHLFDPSITATQDVEIYDPVTVAPPILILPWDPVGKLPHKYKLKAEGGSGNYTWVSSNSSVVTVNLKGEIITDSLTGEAKVTAADARNSRHADSMMVHVLPPSDMEFLPSPVEAELGSKLDLPLAVYAKLGNGGEKKRFGECQFMTFKVFIHEKHIFRIVGEAAPTVDGSCTTLTIQAMTLGHTEVTVTYEYMNIKLQASVTVAAYKPLRPLDPEFVSVVTPAASKKVIFEGGPQAWVLDPSKYYQRVEAEMSALVKMTPVTAYESQKSFHVFTVHCLRLGEQKLSIDVGNQPTHKNQFPASAKASIRFACEEPRGLRLLPQVKLPVGLPPCPISIEFDDTVPVHSYRDLDLLVLVTDSQGRKFDNFSSLVIDWELSDKSLATFDEEEDITTEMSLTETGLYSISAHKTLTTLDKVGRLTVTASIVKYKSGLPELKGRDLKISTPIRKSTDLSLVEDVVLTPEYLTIYNHPTNKEFLTVQRGSGHFHVTEGATSMAKVVYEEKSKRAKVSPVAEGTFTVTVQDLCLETRVPAKATVFISDVYSVELWVVDKVEQHKEVLARVQIFEKNQQRIPAKYFPLMHLKPKTGMDIITVSKESEGLSDEEAQFTALYKVRGVSLGRTMLQFTATQKTGHMIESTAREIQVFRALRLEPRNITLLIGSQFEVEAQGGPQPQSTIQFSMNDDDIATVSSSGLIDALTLGSTKVVGKAIGFDDNKGLIVYSEDEVTVNVIQLAGIKIYRPLKRLQTGTQMPMYATGIGENLNPFCFSVTPPLSFHWTISNQQVAQLRPLFYKSGIQPLQENDFATRFFSKEEGHVTVTLSVMPGPNSKVQLRERSKFIDEVQIQMFGRLRLTSPDTQDGILLITPDTGTQVTTNRDGTSARLDYTVLTSSPGTQGKTPVITVNNMGYVVSGAQSGQASLLVTSHEDFGVNQSLVILVRVKPVSYLMLNADTVISTRGWQLTSVPIGTTLHFTVSFHDDVGERFHATNSKIRFRPNRYDLLQISHGSQNDTLVARATNIGQTILKVWDGSNPGVADYVNIQVGNAILPTQTRLTLGDIICFTTPILSDDGHVGSWFSGSDVVHVDKRSGITVARQVGSSIVSYNVSSSLVTYTEVTVEPVARVSLDAEHDRFLSNVASKTRDVIIRVSLHGSGQHEKRTSVYGSNCSQLLASADDAVWWIPLSCKLAMKRSHPQIYVEELVRVVAEFDASTGRYQCRLTQLSSLDLAHAISTLDTDLELKVIVGQREGQPEVTSNVLSIPYLPGFSVHTAELQLSNVIPTTRLRISATDVVLRELQVTSNDESLVEVLPQEKSSDTDHVALYPIRIRDLYTVWDRNQLETSLEVRSSLTGQTQTIIVRLKLIGEKSDQQRAPVTWGQLLVVFASNYNNVIFLLLGIVTTIGVVYIAHYFVLGQRYHAVASDSMIQPSTFLTPSPRQSPTGAPTTSPWASPSFKSPKSPALWSVDYGPYDGSSIYRNRRSPQQ